MQHRDYSTEDCGQKALVRLLGTCRCVQTIVLKSQNSTAPEYMTLTTATATGTVTHTQQLVRVHILFTGHPYQSFNSRISYYDRKLLPFHNGKILQY